MSNSSIQEIKSLEAIIKTKQAWHKAIDNNIIEVKKVHKDVDFLKSNDGLIVLPLELEKKLKGKKTPEELEQSMDRVVGLSDGKIDEVSKVTFLKTENIKTDKFILISIKKTKKLTKYNDDEEFKILYKNKK